MTTERSSKSDRELWRSLALDDGPSSSAAVSDLDFAAWLDGRLPEAEAARIDAAVARDPELSAAAVEVAEILGRPLPAPPARLVVRAQALVGFAAERSVGRHVHTGGLTSLAAFLSPFGSLQRGLMAGLAIAVAAAGFVMGGGLGESFAAQKYASVEDSSAFFGPLGADTSHQLNDLFTDSI
jgi:hypothetical protein